MLKPIKLPSLLRESAEAVDSFNEKLESLVTRDRSSEDFSEDPGGTLNQRFALLRYYRSLLQEKRDLLSPGGVIAESVETKSTEMWAERKTILETHYAELRRLKEAGSSVYRNQPEEVKCEAADAIQRQIDGFARWLGSDDNAITNINAAIDSVNEILAQIERNVFGDKALALLA